MNSWELRQRQRRVLRLIKQSDYERAERFVRHVVKDIFRQDISEKKLRKTAKKVLRDTYIPTKVEP